MKIRDKTPLLPLYCLWLSLSVKEACHGKGLVLNKLSFFPVFYLRLQTKRGQPQKSQPQYFALIENAD